MAIEAAERRDLLDGGEVERLRERSRGRHGLKPLNAAIAELRGPAPWTQSELERTFLSFVREAGLPEPQANVVVEGYLVDFWWPAARLVVEIDGWAFHKGRARFEDDRIRDTKLQLANCRVLHVTQLRIERFPQELLRDLVRALAVGPVAAA